MAKKITSENKLFNFETYSKSFPSEDLLNVNYDLNKTNERIVRKVSEISSNEIKKIQSKSKETEKDINEMRKKLLSMENELRTSSVQAISLFGVFTSILSFVLININLVKEVSSIEKGFMFIAFSGLVLFSFTSLFVLLLLAIANIEFSEKRLRYICWSLVIPILALFSLYFFGLYLDNKVI